MATAVGHEALLTGAKVVNDTLREVFFDTDATVVSLLKPSATDREFTTIVELSEGWFFEFDDYRKQFVLEIASTDETLEENVAEATHVDVAGHGVFVIVRGDVTPPAGTDVTWKIGCEKFPARGQFRALY